TVALLVRPTDLHPATEGWQVYLAVILPCLALSFPCLLAQLKPSRLEASPITLCVLGLLPAVALSHLSHFLFGQAFEESKEFFKTLLYYGLLVGLLHTPARLRRFLTWFLLCILALAVLAVLNHFGVIQIRTVVGLHDARTDFRLRTVGIFNDPND